jgi:hypothetical protein
MVCESHGELSPLAPYGERYERIAAPSRRPLHSGEEFFFQRVCFEVKFALCDLLWSGVAEAQFANPKSGLRTYWWAEYAARHRARPVEIACAGFGVQCWTGFVVGELFEPFLILAKDATGRVARKLSTQTGDRHGGALANSLCTFRIMLLKFSQAFFQPERVKLVDGKYSNATLDTSGVTREP